MPQSYSALYVHVVFSTKHRAADIDAEMQGRLFEYVGGILRQRKCVLMADGGITDHVHLLVSQGREWGLSDLMRDVKSLSSGWVHDTFADKSRFEWQTGFAGFSVSQSNLDAARSYLAPQEEHHRKMTFQEELIKLLRKHEIEFDERYVFE